MKKNWVLFFVVCGITYIWLFYVQYQKQQGFEREMAVWEEQMEAYEAAKAEEDRRREEARQQLAEARAALAGQPETTTPESAELQEITEVETEAPEAAAPPRERLEIPSMAGISDEQRQLLRQVLTVEDVPFETVDTDLYKVEISKLGARPISWQIKDSRYVHNIDVDNGGGEVAVDLVPQAGDLTMRSFPLEFVGDTVRDFNAEVFDVEREELDGVTRLIFTSEPINGMRVTKDFLFRHDSYVVDLKVTYANGPETRKRLGRDPGFGIGWQAGFGQPKIKERFRSYDAAVVAYGGDIRSRRVDRTSQPDIISADWIDWAGHELKYFIALIIPGEGNPSPVRTVRSWFDSRNDAEEYRLRGSNDPISVDLMHPPGVIEPDETIVYNYQMFVGPRNRQALLSPEFTLARGSIPPADMIFHQVPLGLGFLRPLCLALLALMRWLHGLIGAWGLAIIGTTIVVRTIIYPLTHWAIKNQARTMIEQQKIRPEMEAINKKFKGDPMKRNQAIMQLYRDHNVNPFGAFRGCLPILLQMPVFLALYVVFEQSVELRGQSFLWIPDLSGPDKLIYWGTPVVLIGSSFNLLPILMGATNYIQMRIMKMPAADEMQERIQRQMTIMMPIVFVFFLYKLPSGLILYWIVSNCISIGQSIMTKRIIAAHMAAHESQKAQDPQQPKGTDTKKKIRGEAPA